MELFLALSRLGELLGDLAGMRASEKGKGVRLMGKSIGQPAVNAAEKEKVGTSKRSQGRNF